MPGRFSDPIGENPTVPVMFPALDFFVARAPEAVSLFHSIKLKHPIIVRHSRRRIRSFRPYFIKAKKKNPKKNPKPLSRRTRRKRRIYLDSNDEKRRMCLTHVWHAKRFRMENLWGMRLPVKVNNIGERDVLRRMTKECVFHDRSYLDCWEVANYAQLSGICPVGVNHPKVRSGVNYCSGLWKVDGQVVASYQAYFVGDKLFMWTHPSARPECEGLLSSVGGVLLKYVSRFELLRPTSLRVINRVLGTDLARHECVPGKVIHAEGVRLFIRDGGQLIDVVVEDPKKAFSIWLRMAHAGISPIGVHDRHQAVLSKYTVPDFPYDFPKSKAGIRNAAHVTQSLLKVEHAKPKHCKLEAHHVESPFFPDWTLVDTSAGFRTIVVEPTGKGFMRLNGHLFLAEKLVGFITSAASDRGDTAVACAYSDGDVHELHCQNPGSANRFRVRTSPCQRDNADSLLVGIANGQ